MTYKRPYKTTKRKNKKMTKRETRAVIKLITAILVLAAGAFSAGTLRERTPKTLSGEHIEAPGLAVRFLDVGQADSILITCGGESILVDAGNEGDGEYLVQALYDYGVDSLEAVIFTHPHEDHMGGGAKVLENIPVDMVYRESLDYDRNSICRELTDTEARAGIPQTDPDPGDTMQVGEAGITFLGPVSYDEENPNNNSVAFRLDYGDTSFVFSGDAEWEEEHEILESGAELACDVLKLGHHGSSNASSYRFLRETNPEAVVISCGYDNSYGHPHRETLERIEDLGAALYRTDTQGTIAVFSDGEHLEFAQEPSVHSDSPAP